MGLKCIGISAVVFAVIGFYVYNAFIAPLPVPDIDENQYWGPSAQKNKKDSPEIKPFSVQYSADVINKLKSQLAEPLNLVEPLEGVGFRYGVNKYKLTELIKYWRDDYLSRWNERQKFLNGLPQFTTEIQGLKIHFIHTLKTTEKAKKVVPLLLIHGWPGSVREFYEIIPKLTKANSDTSFIVVAPSLPGYGFSDAARIPGLAATEVSVVLRNLMLKLGYDRFLIQGGDWGSLIGSTIATLFPQNVIGYHSNLCATLDPMVSPVKAMIASIHPSSFMPKEYVDLIYPMGEKFESTLEESGYMHIQASKPDTIGAALSHNPVGLAAYILEKFSTWTNANYRDTNDGGLDNDFTKEALFDNLMIYYLTNSITTSQRLYAESFSKRHWGLQMYRVPTSVPTGCARFRYDLLHEFDWQLNSKYLNLIHSTWHNDGGHFIALQLPNILYDDFIQFVGKLNLTS